MSDLRKKLKLDAKQEQAWTDYENVLSANMKATQERRQTDLSSMSAPERLERAQQLMRERDERMTVQLKTMNDFYSTLTPEQQQIFDAEAHPAPTGTYQRGRWHRNR